MPKPLSEWIHLLFPNNQIPGKVIFRIDAGRLWGLSFGHLSRCLVLAHYFQDIYGIKSLFLMRDYSEGVSHALSSGQIVKEIQSGLNRVQEREVILQTIDEFGTGIFIIDLPYKDLDTSYFAMLRKNGVRIVFIDDSRFISPDADVVLNSNILANKKTSRSKDKNICYLLGPDYFIFKEPDRNMTRHRRSDSKRVLITFGGSDPAGLTLKVLRSLSKKKWYNIEIMVILGPGFADTEQITEYVQGNMKNARIICNPQDIYPFFLDCDLAICAGGRTLYELYALNVPSFAIASIEHEIPVIKEFLNQGMLLDGIQLWDEQEFNRQLAYCLNFLSKQKEALDYAGQNKCF